MADEKKKNKRAGRWVLIITIVTFILSVLFSLIANIITAALDIYFAFVVLLVVVSIGVVFDIVGIAVAVADETPFHALAAKKVKGAKSAILLLRNAEKVSNVCNDVIGDIAGILSGSISAVIVAYMVAKYGFAPEVIPSVIITSIVAAITVGGKALGKTAAIKQSGNIVLFVAKIIHVFRFGKK